MVLVFVDIDGAIAGSAPHLRRRFFVRLAGCSGMSILAAEVSMGSCFALEGLRCVAVWGLAMFRGSARHAVACRHRIKT